MRRNWTDTVKLHNARVRATQIALDKGELVRCRWCETPTANLGTRECDRCWDGEVLAWHFVGRTLRDGRPVPADGVELRHDGPVVMSARGLHASVRAIDALLYAPGATACRVLMRDVVTTGTDKLVARSRTILWRVDATEVLREFARNGALDVLHVWATPETPDIDVVVEYLLTGDGSLRDTARDVARDAARGARVAEAAAWDPAWDAARAAARAASGDAVWDVAWDVARDVARAAARLAARDAWVAGDAVWITAPPARDVARDAGDAVWDAQNARLERMLEAARWSESVSGGVTKPQRY